MCFVYLLQAGKATYSPHFHTTWGPPFRASLYLILPLHDKNIFVLIRLFRKLKSSISIIWNACAGWVLLGCSYSSTRERGTFLLMLLPCLAVDIYYAAVAPAITTVAHAASLLLGAVLHLSVARFSGVGLGRSTKPTTNERLYSEN